MPQELIFPPFNPDSTWRAIDDRVRGGSSHSYLEAYCGSTVGVENVRGGDEEKLVGGCKCVKGKCGVRFYGTLDIKTLGGAGFASQVHSFTPSLSLPPTKFSSLAITLLTPILPTSDEKPTHSPHTFTLTLKTSIPQLRKDGRRESTISYEYSFESPTSPNIPKPNPTPPSRIVIPFTAFTPTYRGRVVPPSDDKYISLQDELAKKDGGVFEMGLMCRSGFGTQEGEFQLIVGKIEAVEIEGLMGMFWSRLVAVASRMWATVSGWLVGREGNIKL